MKDILSSFIPQPWATSQVGFVKCLFLIYLLKKCVRGCAVKLSAPIVKSTMITAIPLMKNKRTLNKKSPHRKLYRLLEKLNYELDRPSALSGTEKLHRAACRYGIKQSPVLHRSQQQPGYTLNKPARKKCPHNKVFVDGLDEQWQCDLCNLKSLSCWNHGV